MSKNYNPSLGLPYIRVESIRINYHQNSFDVELLERDAALVSGEVLRIDSAPNVRRFSMSLSPDGLAQSFPLRDYGTGEPSGGDVTLGEVVLGILAVVRAKQLELDQAAAAP